jgi:membrane protein DedA with SNARE-associated domain
MTTDLTVILGAFLQELVSPLPSFVVFVPGGVALQAEHASIWHVLILTLIIAVVRVVAGLILYGGAERLSTWLFTKRKAKKQLERVRAKLSQKGSWWTIFILWALPVVPSTIISLGAGFVKVPLRTFVTATYAGAIINALTYLLIGYYGLQASVTILGL